MRYSVASKRSIGPGDLRSCLGDSPAFRTANRLFNSRAVGRATGSSRIMSYTKGRRNSRLVYPCATIEQHAIRKQRSQRTFRK